MYVYMHTCAYTYTYTFTYTYMYISQDTYIYRYTYTCMLYIHIQGPFYAELSRHTVDGPYLSSWGLLGAQFDDPEISLRRMSGRRGL